MTPKSLREKIMDDPIKGATELKNYFHNNKKPIYKLLMNDFFPDPTVPYKKKIFINFSNNLEQAMNHIEVSCNTVRINKILHLTRSIQQRSIEISDILESMDFFKLDLKIQLLIIVNYVEFIHSRSKYLLKKNIKKNSDYFFQYESVIKDNPQADNLSYSDLDESSIEQAELIIRYIHYYQKNIKPHVEELVLDEIEFFNILEAIEYEKILRLAHEKLMLENIWTRIKYNDWSIDITTVDDMLTYELNPKHKKEVLSERLAIKRFHHELTNQIKCVFADQHQELFISSNARNIVIDNMNTFFDLLEDHHLPHKYAKIPNDILTKCGDSKLAELFYPYLNKLEFGNKCPVTYQEFREVYLNLHYLGNMYDIFIETKFEQGFSIQLDTRTLFIKKDYFCNKLAKNTGISIDKINECIQMLTFTGDRNSIDLFTQPIIVHDQHILFAPTLINQMNYTRVIELLNHKYGKKIRNKGTVFEKSLFEFMEKIPYVKIETNKIKYIAFDGREIEFDNIIKFDDYILLIEMKSVKRPFDPIEIKNCESEITDAVDQLKRRELSLINDWLKLKNLSSSEIFNEKPQKKKIIKIACLNIFNYTGQTIDDCYITDIRAFTRFWHKPNIYNELREKGDVMSRKLMTRLWVNNKPNIRDLLNHLTNPFYIKYYYKSMHEHYRELKCNGLMNIRRFEYTLEDNPYAEFS
ncbi:hypothetical protein [Wukongibacter baidiensis]